MQQKTYIAIDLKSFYASVACVDRGLDPLTTHLVVADASRTEKTICLAVTPALKAHGISGRARLFEVIERVEQVNAARKRNAPGGVLTGNAADSITLNSDPGYALDYIVAPPEMAHYMEVSTKIYQIYLKYVAPEDIFVYSIDEVFIDATPYLASRKQTAHDFARTMIRDVLKTTGITATAGIGPNLYLCKIAMDIYAKKQKADEDGVRVAELTERSFREHLWEHQPLTDFWRLGAGYARRLNAAGLYTMGDVARYSIDHADALYKMFGVNAELLIDHAWGYESCTMQDVKAYRPKSNSLSSGQVLTRPYAFGEARLVVWEMTDLLALDLVKKGLVTDQLDLSVGYDISGATRDFQGAVKVDYYGRKVPKGAHGSQNLPFPTNSAKVLLETIQALFDRIVNPELPVRRMYVVANHIVPIRENAEPVCEQLDLFSDPEAERRQQALLEREQRRQQTILRIQERYGKNAILKGKNFEPGATTRERNGQIGGHRA